MAPDAFAHVVEGEAEIVSSAQPHRWLGSGMILPPSSQPHALKALKRFKMILTMIRSQASVISDHADKKTLSRW